MIRNILKADAIYGVGSPEQLARKHRAALTKLRQRGVQAVEHRAIGALVMRVNHGRWLGDCVCGAGVGGHPAWPEARCFACGAVYTPSFPAEAEAIEAVLVARPAVDTRNWQPGESVATLEAENRARGLQERG
jgi:hypothetical protein